MAGKLRKLTAFSAAIIFALSVITYAVADEDDYTDYYEEEYDYDYGNDSDSDYDYDSDYGDDNDNDYDDGDDYDYNYDDDTDSDNDYDSGYEDDETSEESSGWDYTIEDDENDDENDDEDDESDDEPSVDDDFDVNENKRESSELARESSELAEKLNITEEELKKKQQYSKELQQKIAKLSSEIKSSNKRINELNALIEEKQEIINSKNKEIKDILNLLRSRLRAIHKAGDTTSLEIILGAKSFSDFLDKAEMVKSMSDHDSQIIESAKTQLKIISEDQRILRESKENLEKEKSALERNNQEINALFDENTKLIEQLTSESNSIKKQQKENKTRQDELKKALEAYKKRLADSGVQIIVSPDPDGGFVWPCPGFTYLTSTFEEWRGANNHGALDIAEAGIYGAQVVACSDGVVFSAYDGCDHDWGKDSSCGCGGGYGNYVMIDHGNGKISIYGHLADVTVSIDQTVSAGQLIGHVGSTGYSTGAHLHFETRYNGVKYDPMTEY